MKTHLPKLALFSLISIASFTLPAHALTEASQHVPASGLTTTNHGLHHKDAASEDKLVADLITSLKAEKDEAKQLQTLSQFLTDHPELTGKVAAAAIKNNPDAAVAITAELVRQVPEQAKEIIVAADKAAPGKHADIQLAADKAEKDALNPNNVAAASPDSPTTDKTIKPTSTDKVDVTLQALVSPSH